MVNKIRTLVISFFQRLQKGVKSMFYNRDSFLYQNSLSHTETVLATEIASRLKLPVLCFREWQLKRKEWPAVDPTPSTYLYSIGQKKSVRQKKSGVFQNNAVYLILTKRCQIFHPSLGMSFYFHGAKFILLIKNISKQFFMLKKKNILTLS